ncbi:MAG: glycosyltransferase, partial [Methanobrevibacter sp.]|nr:glycosyltransferase [Methanobrevibacter sp.]
MKVSVITPNYNGEKFLESFFTSLKIEKEFIEEIILIDNGSHDNSIELIQKIASSSDLNIKLIKNTKNLGFSKAVNQGIEIAKSEYVYLLNNDTEIVKGTIFNLIDFIKDKMNIFSLSSKMIQMDNKELIDDAGDEYTLL